MIAGRKCLQCGKGVFKMKDNYSPFLYKNHPGVTLTKPIQLPTCTNCGETAFSGGMCKQLDDAIVAHLKQTGDRRHE